MLGLTSLEVTNFIFHVNEESNKNVNERSG